MDEIILNLLPMGLAIYSILLIIKSWPHPRTRLLRVAAVAVGVPLGLAVGGWPGGLITGLAAASVAPYALQRWESSVPSPSVDSTEKVEEGPPQVHK